MQLAQKVFRLGLALIGGVLCVSWFVGWLDGGMTSSAAHAKASDTPTHIVILADPPLLLQPELSRQNMLAQQTAALQTIARTLNRSITPQHRYTLATNGFALRLTAAEAAQIAHMPGVARVLPNRSYQPASDAGPTWIGAGAVWDGTAVSGTATLGEGVLIGFIDTGVNMDHPSFVASDYTGYSYTNPLGSGSYLGWCAADPVSYVCNDKLIGVWSYPEAGGDPEDDWGHGSNVASIAAGNFVTASRAAPTIVLSATISGVAPHASLISYDVCSAATGGCPLSAILAAIDQAVSDGVDVINFSIGSPAVDPWLDPVAQAFLAARTAGVVVVTSVGNDGPAPGTVLSPGNAPWLTTVAFGTHDRTYRNALVGMSGGVTPPADMTGKSITAGYGPAPIVYAANFTNTGGGLDNGRCATTFPANTWSGEIVICDAGGVSREQKGMNALAGGAGGIVVADSSPRRTPYALPGVNLLPADVAALKSWLAAGSGHTATIAGSWSNYDPADGDVLNSASARGPNTNAEDILNPDLMAPGVVIWGAVATTNPADPPEYGYYQGSSQASPHVAGAAALLLALHPDWSPAEVESALMMTAVTQNVVQADGVTPTTPFDVGAGRVDVAAAAGAGLVMDENAVAFRAANPGTGGDPRQLNRASLADSQCVDVCQWTRTVKNPLSITTTWQVTAVNNSQFTINNSPFTLPPGQSQIITVTAVLTGALDVWQFGQIVFTETNGLAPGAHWPVAVRRTAARFPASLQIHTRRFAGSQLLTGQVTAVPTLTLSATNLARLEPITGTFLEDPTNGDPFDALTGTVVITRAVPAGSRQFVAEVLATTAVDVDLFVGLDTGDELPQASEIVCTAATAAALESCRLDDPAAGTYWVLAQNWAGSLSQPDGITLGTAVIPTSSGSNSFVIAPGGTAVSGTLPIRYGWSLPTARPGETWVGLLDVGSQPAAPRDLAAIPVTLIRHEDDIGFTTTPLTASVGVTLTHTITILPNVTPADVAYTLTGFFPNSQWSSTFVMPAFDETSFVYKQVDLVRADQCNRTLQFSLAAVVDDPYSPPVEWGTAVDVVCEQVYLPVISKQ